MKVKINGEEKNLAEEMNISQMLDSFNINKKTVVVELNEIIIKRDNWEETVIKENDSIEIVTFMGGGC